MFLQCALNGTRAPGEHDALPLTPAELARDARAVVEAGAKALHLHPRGDDGLESLAPAAVDATVAALREAVPDVELSLTTGLWVTGGDVAQRLAHVRGWSELPDCVSLNVGEEGWRELGELLAGRGVWIEAGLSAPRHPAHLADSGLAQQGGGRSRCRAAGPSGRRCTSSRCGRRRRRPSSSGRCSRGVAKVASTATAAPAAWAPSISRSSSATPMSGLVGVSTHSSAAPSHARSTASVSVMSASTSSTRPAAARSRSSLRTPV